MLARRPRPVEAGARPGGLLRAPTPALPDGRGPGYRTGHAPARRRPATHPRPDGSPGTAPGRARPAARGPRPGPGRGPPGAAVAAALRQLADGRLRPQGR